MFEKPFDQPSVMTAQQHFSRLPAVNRQMERSEFDMSHGIKTTFDFGYLIPFWVEEVLPGDTFKMKSTVFARLATPLKPIMDNLFVDVHYWFVPNRLTWAKWQRFCGERINPADDPTSLVIPQVELALSGDGLDMCNYFGIPRVPDYEETYPVNALPFRAYNLIYNEWYRDQNLIDSVPDNRDSDGPDAEADYVIQRRGKRHDYFTSCLPWPQKGDPVSISVLGLAPVDGIFVRSTGNPTTFTGTFNQADGTSISPLSGWNSEGDQVLFRDNPDLGNYPAIFADLSQAEGVSINDLRTAFQIQKLLERDARGGTRYTEIIENHFGVVSDDARLQRPEYLGGATQRVNINPLASTAISGSVPQANLAGVGTLVNRSGFTRSFTEHGYIIGIISGRADLTYQQGLQRMWSRRTRYDFYWPAFAHLGEQAVLRKEIYFTGDTASDEAVFGYNERFAEYRYRPSLITGAFNSLYSAPLDSWHVSQEFDSAPLLNQDFIEENPPIDRVIAVPAEPHLLCDVWHDLRAQRPLPVYSIPGFIDQF